MPYEIEISDVGEAEYPLIRVLADTIFAPFAPQDRPAVDSALGPGYLHALAHLEGNPLGFIIAGPTGAEALEIQACGVLLEYRRQGVGSRLMRHVEGFALGRRKDTVFTARPVHRDMIQLALERHYERDNPPQPRSAPARSGDAPLRFRLPAPAPDAS